MDSEIIKFFNQQYAMYITAHLSEEEAVEFAFFDMKKKYGENLNLPLLLKLPKLLNYLKKNPKGEKSYFHFGRPNSQLSQLNAALSQKYL
ncbi:MAG: hypothetical protein IJ638_00455 [Alphaproteobacteria bacterium]|nr:hypothetical protein [Alphaproteobacteria bacterium]